MGGFVCDFLGVGLVVLCLVLGCICCFAAWVLFDSFAFAFGFYFSCFWVVLILCLRFSLRVSLGFLTVSL